MSIPHSAAQCEKQLRQIKVSVFVPVSTFRRLLCFFPSCVQTSAGERLDCRRAEPGHYARNDISLKVFKNVFKTTKAFDVISLNVYFFKNSNL